MFRIFVFACLVHSAFGHGWVHAPISRNEMQAHHYASGMPDSLRWEPQTCYWGNTAGHMAAGAGYSCGAKEAAASEGLSTWQKWYDASKVPVPTISAGEDVTLKITITADHGGQSWLMISCDDHIGEDVQWTYLERAQGDRDKHFMPSNPGIYAWATSEAASTTGDEITASWTVPKNFTCSTGKVVGRWLWKTGSSCNDDSNIGRKTQKFVVGEFAKVVHAFQAGGWVKPACTVPPETFISCLDFVMTPSGPPSPPSPTPPSPPPAPPTPPPTPKTPTCCWSNWGDDSTCGQYTGPGAQCNTDPSKKCTSTNDCPKASTISKELPPPPPCPLKLKVVTPKCCWSKWGDASSCGSYITAQGGSQCNTDQSKSCTGDSDCPAQGPPTPPPPAPTPPSPPAPTPTPPAPTPTPPAPTPPAPPAPVPPAPVPGPQAVNNCHDAAIAYCTTKGGDCKACQAWGTWGDMFFVTICNDDPTVCHSPLQAAGNVTCSCQQAGGCTAHGATCAGPSLLV